MRKKLYSFLKSRNPLKKTGSKAKFIHRRVSEPSQWEKMRTIKTKTGKRVIIGFRDHLSSGKYRHSGLQAVLTPKKKHNPMYARPVKIYDKILSISALKGKDSHWANTPFEHNFGRSKASIYGLPDGSILIKGKKRLWAKKQYNQ